MNLKYDRKTLHRLDAMDGNTSALRAPREYILALARRLAFVEGQLDAQKETSAADIRARRHMRRERNAHFWLLSQYALLTGYNVRRLLEEVDATSPLHLTAFDAFFAKVKQERERIAAAHATRTQTARVARAA